MLELLPPAARKVPGLKRRGEGLGLRDHHDEHDDDHDHDNRYLLQIVEIFLCTSYVICKLSRLITFCKILLNLTSLMEASTKMFRLFGP